MADAPEPSPIDAPDEEAFKPSTLEEEKEEKERQEKFAVIERRLGAVEKLPTLPAVLTRIQKMLENPDVNVDELARVLSSDPALVTQVLRLVNSASYGVKNKVLSVSQAINLLGLKSLADITMGIAVTRAFKNMKGTVLFNPVEFWIHCFCCAALSKRIAQHMSFLDWEACFLSGLLHDLGRMVMHHALGAEYAEVMQASRRKRIPLLAAEKAAFLFTHGEVGVFLAEKWSLPPGLKAVMECHHSPDMAGRRWQNYRSLILMVGKSNQICIKEGLGDSGEFNPSPEANFKDIDLSRFDIPAAIRDLQADARSVVSHWLGN